MNPRWNDISLIFGIPMQKNKIIEIAGFEIEIIPGRSPEKNLLSAILGSALVDMRGNRPAKTRKFAYDYFMNRGKYAGYTDGFAHIENVCRELDLCVEALRQKVQQIYENPDDNDFSW